jgi:8-oxoguanine deaminase
MLVKNANLVVTMNAARREIKHDGLYTIEDKQIVTVGPTGALLDTANEVLDLTGHIVLPELINIHQPRVLDAHPRC